MDENQPTWTFRGGQSAETNQGDYDYTVEEQSITWTASEYIAHDKSSGWYFALLGGSIVVTGIVFMLTQDLITAGVILFSSVLLGFVAARKPDARQYELSSKGLQIGPQRYRFEDFGSFSVVEEGAIDSIWLKPLARFKPMVVIYFAPEDEDKIVQLLSQFLPHEERELDPLERASRRLRF